MRKQIIQDAVSGKLTGTPFIPDEKFIREEMERRASRLTTDTIANISSFKEITGENVIDTLQGITGKMDSLAYRTNHLLKDIDTCREDITHNSNRISRIIEELNSDIDGEEAIGSHSEVWTKSLVEDFRTADNISKDSNISHDALNHCVKLPFVANKVFPSWEGTEATLNTVSGNVINLRTSPGSVLNNLIDGSKETYSIVFDTTTDGISEVAFTVSTTKENLALRTNRIELSTLSPAVCELSIITRDKNFLSVGRQKILGRGSWSFPVTDVSGVRFIFRVENKPKNQIVLDDLTFYMDIYSTLGTYISRTMDFDEVVSHLSLVPEEILPPGTDIKYFLAVDPAVSGQFLNSGDVAVSPGPLSVRFNEDGPLTHVASQVKEYGNMSGASKYVNWTPSWTEIRPANKPVGTLPSVITFEHIEHASYPSGLAGRVSMTSTEEVPPIVYESDIPGWWRPQIGEHRVESVPAASSSFPDYTLNGVDFYKIYYWPPSKLPLTGSVSLNTGFHDNNTVPSPSSILWDTAEQTVPGLLDVTARHLTPSSSGILEIDAPGDVLYDSIRSLRYDGSHTQPFVRGDDYQVFGSGAFVEIDVSVIQAINDAFSSSTREFEVTYTVEKTSGVIDTYTYSTNVWVSEDAEAYVKFSNPNTLQRIQIISVDRDRSIDKVTDIPYPSNGGDPVELKLEPGYNRILLVSDSNTYAVTDDVSFRTVKGSIASVGSVFGMQETSWQNLLTRTQRWNHSSFALMPAPSGGMWLMVNDPGSEGSKVVGNVGLGSGYNGSEDYVGLFHDTASGVLSFYHLEYDTYNQNQQNVLLKAELSTNDPYVTPYLHAFRVDTGGKLKKIDRNILDTITDTRGMR